jgi:hypothetical protein
MPWWDIFTLDGCELPSVLARLVTDSLCGQKKRKPALLGSGACADNDAFIVNVVQDQLCLQTDVEAMESGNDRVGARGSLEIRT